ncbi:flagellin [Neobacillus notoginsengisoli]|uniref:Flagellin n=1 Tax=Neobacillus notoginsengisoli TaxID=1578198 RepID=A0A417YJX5_9BACI|nr:flagellin [Neobacillus notoginsengisoli]RHW33322.1 flagellin [Neobacillus notoginsengisoli]
MIINNNIGALNTHRQLTLNSANQAKSMEKLSSGLRINRGADDAAGLSISEKMRAQIRGLDQAQRNAQDGISLIQTADGALNESHAVLQRMRELLVQGGSDTLDTNDLEAIDAELTELNSQLDDIANRTDFNGTKLLNGDFAGKTLQIGANATEIMTIDIAQKFLAADLGVDGVKAGSTTFDADIALIDTAIATVSTTRATLGAQQNRLEFTSNNLASTSNNLGAAESRIRDVDMAKEVVENSKNGILAQAAQAMLAQANQQPQSVLQLLR